LATRWKTRGGRIIAAYARSRWDASLADSSATLRLSGDHASESGQSAADLLQEETRLLRFETGSRERSVGIMWSASTFDQRLTIDDIPGRDHTHYGIDGAFSTGHGRLFAEGALSSIADGSRSHAGRAVAAGWHRKTEVTQLQIRLRHLSPHYTAIRSAPNAAYVGSNERGISAAFRFRPGTGFLLDGFIDRHQNIRTPLGGSSRRHGTRSRLAATRRFSRQISVDGRIATVIERSQNRKPPTDIHAVSGLDSEHGAGRSSNSGQNGSRVGILIGPPPSLPAEK
jgi:hypothetical protein